MRDLLDGSHLAWLDGVEQMPNLKRPRDFNLALTAHLRSVET
jgi:hypothetical protein